MVSLGPICFPKVAADALGWARFPCNSFAWAHTFLTKVLQTPWGGPVHMRQQAPPMTLYGPVTCSTLLPMVSLGPICFSKVAADTPGWACCPCNSCCCNSFAWVHKFLTKVLQTPRGGPVHIHQQSPPIALHGPVTLQESAADALGWAGGLAAVSAADGFTWAHLFSQSCCRRPRVGLFPLQQVLLQ